MLRYIGATLIAALLLAVALRSRADSDASDASRVSPDAGVEGAVPARAVPALEKPLVQVTDVAGGRMLTVTQRLAGSVSRATLVYDLAGEERTADSTSCRRSLGSGSELAADGYVTEVKLSGKLPHGAKRVRILLEDETGSREVPLDG